MATLDEKIAGNEGPYRLGLVALNPAVVLPCTYLGLAAAKAGECVGCGVMLAVASIISFMSYYPIISYKESPQNSK
jgi:hypothetical protein